jgi:gliding motility-associated-like protein
VGNATAGADQTVCPTAAPFALVGAPAGGVWTGPGVSGSLATGFVFTPSPNLTGPQMLTYTLGTGPNACTATRRVSIATPPALQPAWEVAPCPENRTAPLRVRFRGGSTAGFTYSWNFDDGTTGTGPAPEHTYAQPGTYSPVVTVGYGPGNACTVRFALAAIEVKAPFFPNIITPNADGLNDTFRPDFACEPKLRVYSRWGQLVYSADKYRNDWDAAGLAAGIYYYLLENPVGGRVKGLVEVQK